MERGPWGWHDASVMKLPAVIALNLVTVLLALLAYDALRAPPETIVVGGEEPAEVAPVKDDDHLERRVDALEQGHKRVPRTVPTDPALLARLDALEAQLADRSEARAATVGAESPPTIDPVVPDEPTAAEIQWFRDLQAAVKRDDLVKRNRARIDKVLDGLPVNLTDAERDAVHEAYAAFQPRVNEIWTEVKMEAEQVAKSGGTIDRRTIVEDTQQVIAAELTEVLGEVVQATDAATISNALVNRGK